MNYGFEFYTFSKTLRKCGYFYRKSRKRKNSTSSLNTSLTNGHTEVMSIRNETIALGTSTGAVFIYSTRSGEIQSTLKDEHMGMTNALVRIN